MTDGPPPLSDTERLARLRLARSENVGPVLFAQLLARYGSATDAIEALPELARRGGRKRPLKVCPAVDAQQEVEALAELGAQLIVLGDAGYPSSLAAIDDPPPALGLLGNARLLQESTLAIVGARNASANGRRFAAKLAGEIGSHGIVVASGLARGIDTAAHQGALESGTVAAVASGLDIIYPKENTELFEEIAANGAVIAENPPGTTPLAKHFPRRNRIISGLSLGVVVVEAAMRSGSLITARLAGEQGREVFAVPGSPFDPRARGTNNLIRQGAVLTESAQDVLENLESMMRAPRARPDLGETPTDLVVHEEADGDGRDQTLILEALGTAPVGVDDVIRQSGLPPAVVVTALLELELAGRIDRLPGNKVALSP